MKTKVVLSCLLIVALLMGACTAAPTQEAAPAPEAAPAKTDETVAEPAALEGSVTLGITAPMTGNNTMTGTQIMNGAKLAQKMINESGGILGKELKLVYEDEGSDIQASVNAMTKLLTNQEVVGVYGSHYSSYIIAVSPAVKEAKKPMLHGGSSINISKENNPYLWMCRLTDDKTGEIMAKAAVDEIGMKNPAIMYLNNSFGSGLMEQTVAALAKLGVTVNPSYLYAFNDDEEQFSPLITMIMNSDADGLIAIDTQATAPILSMQVTAAGFEKPCLGSSSFTGPIMLDTAPESVEGWYALTDWLCAASSDSAKKFVEAYRAEYNSDPDMPAAICYDSLNLFAEACRLAETTEDCEAINAALGQIKEYPGATSVYTPNEVNCFCTSNFLALNKDGDATLVEAISIR